MRTLLALLLLLLPLSLPVSAQEIHVTDDDGRSVSLPRPATRIISLAPSMTELLFSLGAGDRVVGVIEYSDFPEQARSLPIVGRYDLLDMEGILALQPDLVVAWKTGNPRSSIARLDALGIPVYIAEPVSLESIAVQMERLGRLTGLEDEAALEAAEFREALQRLKEANVGKPALSVFYQVWHSPLITVGGPELINDIIGLCGGRNIFADLPVGPKVSVEAVLEQDPEVIIASGMDAARPEWLDAWKRWDRLRAVQAGNLFFIPPDLVQRHSLRAIEGARQMCRHLDTARKQ